MGYPRSSYSRSGYPKARATRVVKMLAAIMLFALLASCGSRADTTAEVGQESAAVATTAPIGYDESTAAAAAAAAAAADDDREDHDEEDHDEEDHDEEDHDEEDREAASASDERADSDAAVQVANAGYLDSYTLIDDSFGTQVTVTVDGDTRTIESNTLPNHKTATSPIVGTRTRSLSKAVAGRCRPTPPTPGRSRSFVRLALR